MAAATGPQAALGCVLFRQIYWDGTNVEESIKMPVLILCIAHKRKERMQAFWIQIHTV
jgi:hypothetical protein